MHIAYYKCRSTSSLSLKWHRHYHYECEAIKKHQITIVCQCDCEFIMRVCTTQKLIRCNGFYLFSNKSRTGQEFNDWSTEKIDWNELFYTQGAKRKNTLRSQKNCVQKDLNQFESNVFDWNRPPFPPDTITSKISIFFYSFIPLVLSQIPIQLAHCFFSLSINTRI